MRNCRKHKQGVGKWGREKAADPRRVKGQVITVGAWGLGPQPWEWCGAGGLRNRGAGAGLGRACQSLEVLGQRGHGKLLCGTRWAVATWRKLVLAAESPASDTEVVRVVAYGTTRCQTEFPAPSFFVSPLPAI